MYDICVVGGGVMGSSTAYHLSKISGLKIALIGPGIILVYILYLNIIPFELLSS